MPRLRPLVLLSAGVTLLAAGAGAWATDADWARTAGLDVWNVGGLEDQLREARTVAAVLRDATEVARDRADTNRLVVHEVRVGARPLADAAALLWRANRDVPGYRTSLELHHTGPTEIARSADNILQRIDNDPELPTTQKAAALARLRAEYAATFGK